MDDGGAAPVTTPARNVAICVGLLALPVAAGFIAAAVEGWPAVFDDAFISYRYAKNLAGGHGITWNPGQPPTEGYTNFLLVVLLAPFLKLGWDPLLVTRVLSYLCAAGMAAALFVGVRRVLGGSVLVASLVASLVLLAPQTQSLCLVGLETVIYALFLLLAFDASVKLAVRGGTREGLLFAGLTFVAILLRPEAVLLYPIAALGFLRRHGRAWRKDLRGLTVATLALAALGGVYMAWRLYAYGPFLPNPFYLKVATGKLLSREGLASVRTFVEHHALLLALLAPAYLLARASDGVRPEVRTAAGMGAAFALLQLLFFARTDTLMDIDGRFLFPLLPVVISASAGALAYGLGRLERAAAGRLMPLLAIVGSFLLLFGLYAQQFDRELSVEREKWLSSEGLMQKELAVAHALEAFPGIENVRIAFGDSGVLPYFSGAQWLDPVGLNDGFIARTRDREALVAYFFEWRPDLVILPGHRDFTWLSYGHGPLGNYAAWTRDARWDGFAYAGTIVTRGIYDLHFMVRRDSPAGELLWAYLRSSVVDGAYEPFPYPLGSADAPWPGQVRFAKRG